jgi:methylmalonyl-CoA mutase cobalamin-binding domain/chain
VYEEIRERCLTAILDSDRELANSIIDQWTQINGYDHILTQVLEPVLEELGNMWTVQKDISFAQVYVSATIAEDIIMKVLHNRSVDTVTVYKGTLVLGNIEDDFHSLGRKLVGIFLMSAGWNVIDLGNDITPKEFVDTAVTNNAKIIIASAMMYTTAQNIKKLRSEIDSRGYKDLIKLAVGGAVFNLRKELWVEVGADGTSRNAIDVGELIEKLYGSFPKAGEGQ